MFEFISLIILFIFVCYYFYYLHKAYKFEKSKLDFLYDELLDLHKKEQIALDSIIILIAKDLNNREE